MDRRTGGQAGQGHGLWKGEQGVRLAKALACGQENRGSGWPRPWPVDRRTGGLGWPRPWPVERKMGVGQAGQGGDTIALACGQENGGPGLWKGVRVAKALACGKESGWPRPWPVERKMGVGQAGQGGDTIALACGQENGGPGLWKGVKVAKALACGKENGGGVRLVKVGW